MPSASKLLGDLVSSAGAISVTSGVANTAITGTITTAQIADDAITTTKVAANAIVTADIAGGNVTAAKLANTAVTAGVYGGSSNSALITVDSQGRITAASNVAAGSGQIQTQIFTAPGTWTKPSSTTQVRVTVIGGGGGGATNINSPSIGKPGGRGGYAKAIVPVSANVTITVGTGGATSTTGSAGGTSSFGPAVSSTGGSGGPNDSTPVASYLPTAAGAGTVSDGTALKTGFAGPAISTADLGGITETFVDGVGSRSPPSAAANYSTTGGYSAGGSGSVGNPALGAGSGGTGGAIIVEFVG